MKNYKKIIENELPKYFDIKKYNLQSRFPSVIFEAMAYTTLMSAKRLRAILCLESCNLFCNDYAPALETACALEMLHAQSLIHDDLPSMDNDDLRRGKPSNHKVYGEAVAILAGDALISFGAQIILENVKKHTNEVLHKYLKSAGVFGIVGGQTLDILSEGKSVDFETLKVIHNLKTATLFDCAIHCGALLGGANNKQLKIMENFAQNFGLAFQIVDDILDEISTIEDLGKSVGKDKSVQKATYVTLFGLDEAKKIATSHICKCYDILTMENLNSKVFEEILSDLKNKIEV